MFKDVQLLPANRGTDPSYIEPSPNTMPIPTTLPTRPPPQPPQPPPQPTRSSRRYQQQIPTGSVVLTRSIEDMFPPNQQPFKRIDVGQFDMEKLKGDINYKKNPTLLVVPHTSLKVYYDDGTSRTITNRSAQGDFILVTTEGVSKISVDNPQVDAVYENFDMTRQSVTFTYYDIFIIIVLVLLVYYYFVNIKNMTNN